MFPAFWIDPVAFWILFIYWIFLSPYWHHALVCVATLNVHVSAPACQSLCLHIVSFDNHFQKCDKVRGRCTYVKMSLGLEQTMNEK